MVHAMSRGLGRFVAPQAALLISLALLFAIAPNTDAAIVAADSASIVVALLATGACFLAMRASNGVVRTAWTAMTVGLALWAVGELIWGYYEVILRQESPFPSMADVAYLLAYPALLLGVILLTVPRSSRARTRTLLDTAIIVIVCAVPVWHYLLGPIAHDGALDPWARAIDIGYPVGDLVLLFGVLVAALRRREAREGPVLTLLSGSIVLFMAADLVFAAWSLEGDAAGGTLLDLGWIGGYLLMMNAALAEAKLRPDHAHEDEAVYAAGWRQALPMFALVPAAGWFIVAGLGGIDRFENEVALLMALLVGIVAVRSVLAMNDLVRVNEELVSTKSDLQASNGTLRERTRQLNFLLMDAIDVGRKDALTGVLNRGAAMDEVERLIRERMPFFLTMVDVNDMKLVNDYEGHHVGDNLLQQVAKRLAELPDSVVGRYGGDEFIVVTTRKRDIERARWDDIVETTLDEFVLVDGRTATVAFGSAAFPHEGHSLDRVMLLADQRLYQHKRDGKKGFAPVIRIA